MTLRGLHARHTVGLVYRRSTGDVVGAFLEGLARRECWGSVGSDGRVAVPPAEFDPVTAAATTELVRVDDVGTVTTWTWVDQPRPEHPLEHPFAFALVVLDGADTALLHVVDAGDEHVMTTGLRVRADWRADRTGSVRDVRAFVPLGPGDDPGDAGAGAGAEVGIAVVPEVVQDVPLTYDFTPGRTVSGFYAALGEGRLEGGRCPGCAAVFVPPRPRCPACGGGAPEPVAVAAIGTVTACTVVHIPVPGLEVPFAWAWIRLDGVDVTFPHLIGGIDPDAVTVGLRVEAEWVAGSERPASWEAIRWFRPAAGGAG